MRIILTILGVLFISIVLIGGQCGIVDTIPTDGETDDGTDGETDGGIDGETDSETDGETDGETDSGFITGDTSTSLTMDNGRNWFNVNAGSDNSYFIHGAGFSGESSWLGSNIHCEPCLTQSEPFYTGIQNRTISILKNTSSVGAYQITYEVYSGSKELTITWKFILPSDKDYTIWTCKFENTGSVSLTVDNPGGYAHQDVYFWENIKPSSTTNMKWRAYGGSESDWNTDNFSTASFTGMAKKFLSIYDGTKCHTFGFLSPYGTDPYMIAIWPHTTPPADTFGLEIHVTKVVLDVGQYKEWRGFVGFHSGGYTEGEAIYDNATINVDSIVALLN